MLVKWKTGKKYNIIPMHDVQKLESYELDSLVYCKFNSAKYLAYIKFIGKFIFCISSIKSFNLFKNCKFLRHKLRMC